MATTVYFVQTTSDDGEGYIKIGRTDGDVMKRLRSIQTGCPVALCVRGVIENADPALEQVLHQRFAAHWSHGEWFHPHAEILDYIRKHARRFKGDHKPMKPTRRPTLIDRLKAEAILNRRRGM